jgi:two-component system heavy metal sensor histidine kinase CusS
VASDIALPEARAARRTLRGRVSLLGLAVIAAWVVVLTVGFDVAMYARLNGERDTVLRNRAAAIAATVFVSSTGVVTAHDHSGDESLDSGIWIYSGAQSIERPQGGRDLQRPVFG